MTLEQIEARVTALETEVSRLKTQLRSAEGRAWWQQWVGAFRGDPHFEEAARLGRQYRESLRPKSGKRQAKKSKKGK
jgi:hypothetical protein